MRAPAWLARLLNPAYGTCYRCRYPWSHVEPRTVWYDEGRGIFALCVGCWKDATLKERLDAHQALVTDLWEQPSEVHRVRMAVHFATLGEKHARDLLGTSPA